MLRNRCPIYDCALEGKLKGAWVDIALGTGWLLPGKPQPRTAVLFVVETKVGLGRHDHRHVTHATLPSTPPDITGFDPSRLDRQPDAMRAMSAAPPTPAARSSQRPAL